MPGPTCTYNGVTWDVSHVALDVAPEFGVNGAVVIGHDCTLRIQGLLSEATTAAAQTTDYQRILGGVLSQSGQLCTLKDSAGTTVLSVGALASGATIEAIAEGPHPTANIPDPAELRLGYLTPIIFTLRFKLTPKGSGGSIVSLSYTDTWDEDIQLRLTRTRRGELVTSAGTSAYAQRDDSTVTPSLPTGYERQSRSFEVDKADRRMSFEIVDQQQHLAHGTDAKDAQWTVQQRVSEGTEHWSFAGELAIEVGTDVETARGMIAGLASTAGIPEGVRWSEWHTTPNQRTGRMAFTLSGERAYGNQSTLAFENSVETESTREFVDWKALGPDDEDARQEPHRPDVRITQTFLIVGRDGYPDPPPHVAPEDVCRVQRLVQGKITPDVKGRGMRYPLSGTRVYEPLNTVQAGSHASAAANLGLENLDGQTSELVALG